MSFLIRGTLPPTQAAMDDSASVLCDVTSGGYWPAGPTSGSGLDVVGQQQLRAAAFYRH